MASAEVSVEKVKSICSITRANIKEERDIRKDIILGEYVKFRLKKHWWEFWKSPIAMSYEQAFNEIRNDMFSSEWPWRLSRALHWKDDDLIVCSKLEWLCKVSNVNMIRVSSEEAALLDLTLNKGE